MDVEGNQIHCAMDIGQMMEQRADGYGSKKAAALAMEYIEG